MDEKPKKTLEERAQDLAWVLSARPDIYIYLVRIINVIVLGVGLILSPFKALKDRLFK